jgi:phosphoserine phosphatase
LAKVEDFVRAQSDASIRLVDATVYTDSVTDLPLLLAVRSPVAVNPDLRLRNYARRQGWPIQQW